MTCVAKSAKGHGIWFAFSQCVLYIPGVTEILTSMTTCLTDSLRSRSSHTTDFRVAQFSLLPTCLLLILKDQPKETMHLKPHEQVLVALRFFASGSFLEVVDDTVGGIPKCSVLRIVSRVSTAFARKQHQFKQWPSTAAERQEIKQGFFEKRGFPRVTGGINGTYIHIQGPSAH